MKMKAQTHRTIYVAIACAAALVLVWTLFLKGAPAGNRAVIALAQALVIAGMILNIRNLNRAERNRKR